LSESTGSVPPPQDPITSYAQNFEDILLHRMFSGVTDGFYIDIGAFDPMIGSVTKVFYDQGWSGINIEPGAIFERLAAARPRDTNLNLAVLDYQGSTEFIQDPNDAGMSRVQLASDADAEIEPAGRQTRRVPCDTLDNIVARYAAGRVINFIKIDAEGAEERIINSTDWKVVRPQVLLIEGTAPWTSDLVSENWEPTLLANGYRRGYFDGINLYFVRSEDTGLLAHFDRPVNVLDRFERYDPGKSKVIADLNSLWDAHAKLRNEAYGASVEKEQALARYEEALARLAALEPRALRYDRLVSNLRADDDSPLSLRAVLPLARLIRAVNRRLRSRTGIRPAPVVTHAEPVRRRLARSLSAAAHAAVGPIARRTRSYLLEPVLPMNQRLEEIARELEALRRTAEHLPQPSNNAPPAASPSSELLRSTEALLLTIAARTPYDERK
jgi:FkbM family methyltransferase